MVKYTGRGLVVKRPGVLSKVQMLNLVLGVGVFSLLPILGGTGRSRVVRDSRVGRERPGQSPSLQHLMQRVHPEAIYCKRGAKCPTLRTAGKQPKEVPSGFW